MKKATKSFYQFGQNITKSACEHVESSRWTGSGRAVKNNLFHSDYWRKKSVLRKESSFVLSTLKKNDSSYRTDRSTVATSDTFIWINLGQTVFVPVNGMTDTAGFAGATTFAI